jgi:hypothetical protein
VNNAADLTKPAPVKAPAQAGAPKRVFKVTYRPGPQDMAKTVWNGITFLANQPVPLSLDNKKHFIENDIPKQHVHEDGSYTTRTQKTLISMIELAKANPFFEVEGFPRFVKPMAPERRPQSPAEYRSWAQAWFADAGGDDSDIQTPKEMLERWDDEEALRERIGVGDEDVIFLKPFFDMKVSRLKKHMAVKDAKNDGGIEMGID